LITVFLERRISDEKSRQRGRRGKLTSMRETIKPTSSSLLLVQSYTIRDLVKVKLDISVTWKAEEE